MEYGEILMMTEYVLNENNFRDMNEKDHNRATYIDQISGLLIVYMILYHIFQWCDKRDFCHSYRMQPLSFFLFWLFYKSGMFYREKHVRKSCMWQKVEKRL